MKSMTIEDFYKIPRLNENLFEIENIDCHVTPIPTTAYPTPAKRPHYSVLNCDKIKRVFGITIPYWRDSLKSCMAILREA